MCQSIELPYEHALDLYDESCDLFDEQSYEHGFLDLMESLDLCNAQLNIISDTISIQEKQEKNKEEYSMILMFTVLIFAIFLIVIVGVKQGFKKRREEGSR
jgi:hypothetical protein